MVVRVDDRQKKPQNLANFRMIDWHHRSRSGDELFPSLRIPPELVPHDMILHSFSHNLSGSIFINEAAAQKFRREMSRGRDTHTRRRSAFKFTTSIGHGPERAGVNLETRKVAWGTQALRPERADAWRCSTNHQFRCVASSSPIPPPPGPMDSLFLAFLIRCA